MDDKLKIAFTKAVNKYGIPKKAYIDTGKSFKKITAENAIKNRKM